MSYLIPSDYQKQIQTDNLNQVTTTTPSIRIAAELAAQAEAISYLVQKYDTSQEFTDTNAYNPALNYNAADRVYLDAPAYSASSAYTINSLALQSGSVYLCTTAIVTPETFDPDHWELLGDQYDLFYAVYPYSVFDLFSMYNEGDMVWWNNHTYTSIIQTVPIDHEALIQFRTTNNVPYLNIFPNDPQQGTFYWNDNGPYTTPTGSLLNTVYFTPGDNRNQQIVMYTIDITLFHLHSRISPRNIPQLRMDRYEAAISWLKMAMKGFITADLVKLQPPQGGRIRFGFNIKNINSY